MRGEDLKVECIVNIHKLPENSGKMVDADAMISAHAGPQFYLSLVIG